MPLTSVIQMNNSLSFLISEEPSNCEYEERTTALNIEARSTLVLVGLCERKPLPCAQEILKL